MDSLRRCIVALVAIERSFATMPFQMLARSISITACTVTLITFLWLFHCVSSNASLNGQLEKLHSCTRCNWKCIAKCGSNFLDQSMLSHTDHICMAFSQMCGNKCLPQMNSQLEKITSVTCCICVIFLPCFTTLVAVICFFALCPSTSSGLT